MITWALYAIAIAAALGLAALAAERALGLYRRPTRWVWVAAMAGSLAVPTVLLVVPRAAPTGAADIRPSVAIEGPFVGPVADRITEASSGWPDLGPWLLGAWGAATLLLFVFFARSAWRLRRARREWLPAEVAGETVLESDSLGPAVVGVVRTRIAIPRWIRDLDEDLQRLVVAHERAHQAAADPLLLWLGLAVCVAVPWCAPLWWQLRRLRLAIEVDCDRRVLAGGASLARYGSLLLEVGRRSGGRPFALVGLFEPRSFLERRIRVMTANTPGDRLLRTAGALLVVLLVGIVAARAPVPPSPPLAWGQESDEPPVADRIDSDTTDFTFTPYEVKPRCLSGCDRADLVRHFGEVETDGCRVTIGIRIDTDGRVVDTDMLQMPRMDGGVACQSAADSWARETRWSPAFLKGEKVVAWIAQPITYAARVEGAPGESSEEALRTTIAPIDTPPRFERTSFDERPVCVENCDADAILAALREGGVEAPSCDVVIGIRIGVEGAVTATDVVKSDPACDATLADWAESTRWRPARRSGEVVPVWIAQPVQLYRDPASRNDSERPGPVHVDAETDPDRIARTELRRAMVAQEVYSAANDEYADAFELDLSPPEMVTIEVRGGGDGFVMVARHDHGTGAFCASSETGTIVEGMDC